MKASCQALGHGRPAPAQMAQRTHEFGRQHPGGVHQLVLRGHLAQHGDGFVAHQMRGLHRVKLGHEDQAVAVEQCHQRGVGDAARVVHRQVDEEAPGLETQTLRKPPGVFHQVGRAQASVRHFDLRQLQPV